ncbi:MAG: hypothetical protein NTW19_21985 [Planctomycetota bacterium]|nr:hypothetical protein [Planctomycetota bacterium]
MPALRQKLLFLCTHTPNLDAGVGAWSLYDGTGKIPPTTGNDEKPPYYSVLHAMKDGWRVIHIPQHLPPYPGTEYTTSFLKFEYVLEKMEEADNG